jgi:hypothetical protein
MALAGATPLGLFVALAEPIPNLKRGVPEGTGVRAGGLMIILLGLEAADTDMGP